MGFEPAYYNVTVQSINRDIVETSSEHFFVY